MVYIPIFHLNTYTPMKISKVKNCWTLKTVKTDTGVPKYENTNSIFHIYELLKVISITHCTNKIILKWS